MGKDGRGGAGRLSPSKPYPLFLSLPLFSFLEAGQALAARLAGWRTAAVTVHYYFSVAQLFLCFFFSRSNVAAGDLFDAHLL